MSVQYKAPFWSISVNCGEAEGVCKDGGLLPLFPVPHSSGQDDLKTEDRTVVEGCDSQRPDKSESPNKLFARRCFMYYRNRIKGRMTKGNS